jgi:hypothetical protein
VPKGWNKKFVSNAPIQIGNEKDSEGQYSSVLRDLKTDIENSLISGSKASVSAKSNVGFKDIANISQKDFKRAIKNMNFFDFEAIGTFGNRNYSPTQFSIRKSDGTSITKMLKLNTESIDYINELIGKVKASKGADDGLTVDERRDLFQMADYSLDGNGNIQSVHRNYEKDVRIKNQGRRFKFRVAGIIEHDNKVLVVKMNQNPFFCFPGGHVELLEET